MSVSKGHKAMQGFKRTMTCGNVSEQLVDTQVIVNGWVHNRRDHGGVIFIDMRDKTGIVQLVFNPENLADMMKVAHSLRSEYVVAAKGLLQHREPDLINPKMPTGKYEIKVTEFKLLAKSQAIPFQIDDSSDKVSEDLRLKYRYLDLRRPKMQKMMEVRHKVVLALRNYLDEQGFCEIETPILSKSTPEGARDFLVPSRLNHGSFYALPQSPQTYKQLFMVSGFEKYFQMARCFRDEDLRAARQLEFTQLDLEMSFVDENDVHETVDGFMSLILKKFLNIELTLPIPRFTYDQVYGLYGSDRPDTRFDLKINNLTELFKSVELSFLQSIIADGGSVGALCVKDYKFSRSELDGWVSKVIKEFGAKGLIYIRFNEDGTPSSPIAKFLPADFLAQAQQAIPGLTAADTLFVVAEKYDYAWGLLGKLRTELGSALKLIDENKHELFWVTEFPMFEWSEEDKKWQAMHHPFTQPQEGWEEKDPGDVRARAYDLVWNGYEVGGGSIRIHDAAMQQKVFDILGIDAETAQHKFGYVLDSQKFGYPPEGGIAMGVERLIMLITGTTSIRDVVAFPKTQKGSCLMMETPSTVDSEQLVELGIKVAKKKLD